MVKNKQTILFLLIICALFIYISITYTTIGNVTKDRIINSLQTIERNEVAKKSKYPIQRNECLKLYQTIRFPKISQIFNPPLAKPPPELYDDFTQHGKLPIRKYWYFNGIQQSNSKIQPITKKEMDQMKKEAMNIKNPLGYNDTDLNELMHFYSSHLVNKSLAVIGTIYPWVEGIGLALNCARIVTLDYYMRDYETPNMFWILVNDYLDAALERGEEALEEFDAVASYSSLEHSGLGRYGDPLNPYGDLDAIRQIHCMLKPGGILFLGLPVTLDGSSYLAFNAARYYGTDRLELLFDGWDLLAKKRTDGQVHMVFVLQKKFDN